MSEHLSWIFSAAAICLWVIAIRNSRRNGGGRRPRAARRQQGAAVPAANGQTEPIVYFATDSYGLPNREYRFEYKLVSGGWRVYILKMPPLNGRSGASSITHRLNDGPRHYICWDRPIRTLEDAQTVSRAWADNLQRYIATGQRF